MVRAILDHCRTTPGLDWLADALATFSYTGLRVGAHFNLRWCDLDFEAGMIRLEDESTSKHWIKH